MISIVIPLFNKASSIKRTLESVFAQSYQDFEIIIVDDGSTDNSTEVVQRIKDRRIRLILQSNAGVSAARNRGIQESAGKFVAFLDADDEWDKNYLQIQHDLIEKYPDCDIFATNYKFRDINGIQFPTSIHNIIFEDDDGILTNYFEIASSSHPPIWTSAVLVTKVALESIGSFPIGITSGEDLLTWARLAVKYKIAYSRKAMSIYQLNTSSEDIQKVGRPHDEIDYVGHSLLLLYHDNKSIPGLKQYISFWFKMRASVSLRSHKPKKAILESLSAIKYNVLNIKAFMILFLSFLPSKLRHFIIR